MKGDPRGFKGLFPTWRISFGDILMGWAGHGAALTGRLSALGLGLVSQSGCWKAALCHRPVRVGGDSQSHPDTEGSALAAAR